MRYVFCCGKRRAIDLQSWDRCPFCRLYHDPIPEEERPDREKRAREREHEDRMLRAFRNRGPWESLYGSIS